MTTPTNNWANLAQKYGQTNQKSGGTGWNALQAKFGNGKNQVAPPQSPQPVSSIVQPKQGNPVSSLFGKAKSVAGGLARGVARSGVDTVTGLATIGQDILGQTAGRVVNAVEGKGFTPSTGSDAQLPAAITPGTPENTKLTTDQGTSEKIGDIIGTTAQFFLPSGLEEDAIAKGSEVLPKLGSWIADESGKLTTLGKATAYGLKALVRGTAAGAITTAQTGSLKKGAETGLAVGLVDAPITWAGKFLGGILKNAASIASGEGRQIIDTIVKDPENSLTGMKDDVANGLRKTAKAIRQYASDTYKNAISTYGKGLKDIEDKYLSSNTNFMKQGNNVIGPDGNFPITLSGVKNKLTSVFQDFGADGNFTKGFTFDNTGSVNLKTVLKSAYNSIKNWTDISPTGLNTLTQRLQRIAENTKLPEAAAAVGKITSNIRDYMGEKIPEIADLNKGYAKTMQFLEDLDTHLSTGVKRGIREGMNTEQGMLDVTKKIAQLFGKDKETARQFIMGIPGGAQMIAEQAGRNVKQGVVSLGGSIPRALSAMIPSKTVGYTTAKVAQYLPGILSKLAPVEQEFIKGLVSQFQGQNKTTPPPATS